MEIEVFVSDGGGALFALTEAGIVRLTRCFPDEGVLVGEVNLVASSLDEFRDSI